MTIEKCPYCGRPSELSRLTALPGLTRRQRDLLSFLSGREDDVMPSYAEMADHLGLKSKSGVARLIRGLEERGRVGRTGTARGLIVIRGISPASKVVT